MTLRKPLVIGSAVAFLQVRSRRAPDCKKIWHSKQLGYFPFSGPVVIESKVVIRLRSIDEEFHVRAVDLARLLKTTENEISRLVRSGVIERVRDPNKQKAFLYPCLSNVMRFVEFRFGERETINRQFLAEKAGREK